MAVEENMQKHKQLKHVETFHKNHHTGVRVHACINFQPILWQEYIYMNEINTWDIFITPKIQFKRRSGQTCKELTIHINIRRSMKKSRREYALKFAHPHTFTHCMASCNFWSHNLTLPLRGELAQRICARNVWMENICMHACSTIFH